MGHFLLGQRVTTERITQRWTWTTQQKNEISPDGKRSKLISLQTNNVDNHHTKFIFFFLFFWREGLLGGRGFWYLFIESFVNFTPLAPPRFVSYLHSLCASDSNSDPKFCHIGGWLGYKWLLTSPLATPVWVLSNKLQCIAMDDYEKQFILSP